MFGYENELVYPIFISKQKFEDSMDLLLLLEEDKLYYVYIKDFNTFMFHKTKNKNKNNDFVKVVYNALVGKIC